MERHPKIDVNLHTSLGLVDLERDGVDLAIRFGTGEWPGLEAVKFLDDELFPVASPRYNRGRLPARPAELAKFRLMRSDDEFWAPWFRAARVKIDEPHSLVFQRLRLPPAGCSRGTRIALARRSIAEDDLRAGRLVRVFDIFGAGARRRNYLAWRRASFAERRVATRLAAAGKRPQAFVKRRRSTLVSRSDPITGRSRIF